MKSNDCQLCGESASLFCPSDDAFLCLNCDQKVHEANFIVARHFRYKCENLTGYTDREISTSYKGLDSVSSSNSSTASPEKEYSGGRRNIQYSSSSVKNSNAGDIFVNWSGKLGLNTADVAVQIACGALRACLDRAKCLPFRVCLAASMWLGLRTGSERRKLLKRLEEISGVPAKLILAAESKLERVMRVEARSQLELEEGWAES